MDWIGLLEKLSPIVAIALLFVWSQRGTQRATIQTIQTISTSIVKPIQDDLRASREDEREDRRVAREAYEAMGKEFKGLCIKLNGTEFVRVDRRGLDGSALTGVE